MSDTGGINVKKIMNDMIEKMAETINKSMLQCFNQLRKDDNIDEPNFTLWSPIHEIKLEDNFKHYSFPKIEAPIDTHMTNLREKIDLSISSLSKISSKIETLKTSLIMSHLTHLFFFLNFMSLRREKNLRVMLVLMMMSGTRTCSMWMGMMNLLC